MKFYVLGANGTIGKVVVEILKKRSMDFEPLYLNESSIKSLSLTKNSIVINCAYDFACLPYEHYKKNIVLFNKILTFCQSRELKLINISTQLVQSDQEDAYIITKQEIEKLVTNINGVNLRVGVLELGTKSDVINRLENVLKKLKFIPGNFQEVKIHLTNYDIFCDNLLKIINNFELFSGLALNCFDLESVSLYELLKSRTSIARKLNIKLALSAIYILAIAFEKTFRKNFFVSSLTLGRLIYPSKLIRNMSRNA